MSEIPPRKIALAAWPARRSGLWWTIVLAAAALAIAQFLYCVLFKDNDFLWHRGLGETFVNNTVYEYFGRHYLPARVMIDAATVWLPYRVDRAVWLLSMCIGLALCVRFWSLLGVDPKSDAARPRVWLPIALLGMGAVACYIQRDLTECGLQIALLCMVTGGLAALVRGRHSLCGFSLGLAVAYKLTPLVFLPYLLWKRQWKPAAWMAVWTVAISLTPAVFLGWQTNVRLHRQWLAYTMQNMALEDPTENGIEPPTMRNQALMLAIARLIQAYPEDHPLRQQEASLTQIAQLSPHTTKRIVQGTLLVMAACLAWRFRRPVDKTDGGVSLGAEWAGVSILSAILSPLCWLQHLVLVLPAALLVARTLATGRAKRWQWGVAGFGLAITLLVHRDLLGQPVCAAINSFTPHAVASLLLLVLTLTSLPASSVSEAKGAAESLLFPSTKPGRTRAA